MNKKTSLKPLRYCSPYNRYFWGLRIWDRFAPLPYPLRRCLGMAIRVIPISTFSGVGLAYSRLRPGSGPISALGDKAHRLGYRLQTVKTSDNLYRSLVSEWFLDSGVLKWVCKQPPSQLDDPLLKFGADNPAMRMMVPDMKNYLPDDILCKLDRAAMGISLETCTPFLDPDVIRQTLIEHLSGRKDRTTRLWAVLMFQAWHTAQAHV